MESILSHHFPQSACIGTSSLEEAMPKLEQHCPDFILLDLSLAGISGVAAITCIRSLHPLVPIIILSGSSDTLDIQHSFEAGANGYLIKSEPSRNIVSAIKHVLNGHQHMPSIMQNPPAQQAIETTKKIDALQFKILRLIAQGKQNNEIAILLDISEATLKQHNRAIFKRLEVSNRTQAVCEAIRLGFIHP